MSALTVLAAGIDFKICKLKKNKKQFLFVLIAVLVAFLMVRGGYIWFKYFYIPIQSLQRIIDASDWNEYSDSNLGYSYIVPQSWTTVVTDNKSTNEHAEFGQEYKISSNAYPQAFVNVIFYKNPKKDNINYLLNGSDPRAKVDPQSRTINDVVYIVIHYPSRLESGFKAGNYLLAKDYSLLVEARLGYTSDRTPWEVKKEEEIVNKIFNSIKKI
ncbi:MAG: hypothetical protein WD992_02435 [Candidatus Levyibacteriota bacterium]